jgi:hypothetical protein
MDDILHTVAQGLFLIPGITLSRPHIAKGPGRRELIGLADSGLAQGFILNRGPADLNLP